MKLSNLDNIYRGFTYSYRRNIGLSNKHIGIANYV